jgi:hypothetical protein
MAQSNRLDLFVPASPGECLARLEAATDQGVWFPSMFGAKPLVGRVTDFTLRLRKQTFYANSFQTRYFATLQPAPGGTIISGSFGMHPFVRAFLVFWFGVLVVVEAILLLVAVGVISLGKDSNLWVGLIVPPVMAAFGLLWIFVGRFMARDEQRFLTDFLIKTLDARVRN